MHIYINKDILTLKNKGTHKNIYWVDKLILIILASLFFNFSIFLCNKIYIIYKKKIPIILGLKPKWKGQY